MYLKDLGSKVMLVTCGEVCYKLTTGGAEEVPDLLSTQEEADICILPVAPCCTSCSSCVIISDEKKGFVSGVFPHILAPLYLRCGTRIHAKFVSIQVDVVNSDCCKSMIGLHTFIA